MLVVHNYILIEGPDLAILAQAILSGIVTKDLQTFKDVFDPESTGPGAAIGEKFSFQTKKGERNLKLNWLKLLRKIEIWKSNKPDPDTNKRKCFLSQTKSIYNKHFS